MRKSKILIVTNAIGHGGAAKRLLLIKDILSKHGIVADIFAVKFTLSKNNEKKLGSIYNLNSDNNLLGQAKTFLLLYKLLKQNKYKIVVCNSRRLYFHCKLFSFIFKYKYINLVQIKYKNSYYIFKFFFGNHIIAASYGVYKYLVNEQKIENSKITVISNSSAPIELETHERQVEIRNNLKLNNKFVITCIARFHIVKGHKYLIEAFAQLRRTYAHIRLLLMGFGELKKDIEAQICELCLQNDVIFVLPDQKVDEIFSITDLLVLPSFREGLPTMVLEGFSAGKTIVATDIPGTNEIVKHNYNGLLVPIKNTIALKNALEKVITDNEFRNKLEENALKTYHNEFSFDKYQQEIIKYFNSLLK